MKTKRLFKICLFLFLQTTTFLWAQEPTWVSSENRKSQYPRNKYLLGYFSESNVASNAQEKVLKIAKKLLIESIQVEIVSTSTLMIENIQKNQDVKTTEHFKNISKSVAEADIVGIQSEIYYDTKSKTAFALAYAEKSKVISYYNNVVDNNFLKIEQKQQIADENQKNGKYQISLGHYYACFPLFEETEKAQALLLALGSYGEDTEPIKKLFTLQTQVQKSISIVHDKLLKDLSIKKTQDKYKYSNNGKGINLTIQAKNERAEVTNIPIRFFYAKNKTEIEKVNTDNEGKATCFIKELEASQKLIVIKAEVDILNYLNITEESTTLQDFIKNYAIPQEKFLIEVQGSTAFVNTNEKLLNQDLNIPLLEPKLKAGLTEKGFEFVSELSEANYYINIISNTRQGNTYQNLYFAYLDATVSVMETDTGDEIYKNAYADIKGGGLNYEQASRKAYKKAVDIIIKDILSKIK